MRHCRVQELTAASQKRIDELQEKCSELEVKLAAAASQIERTEKVIAEEAAAHQANLSEKEKNFEET